MSLRVWLPFTKTTTNQGLNENNITVTDSTGSLVDGGKLGKCIHTTSTGNVSLNVSSAIINNGDITVCGWFKFNKAEIQAVVDTLTITSTAIYATGGIIGNNNYGGFGLLWRTNDVYKTDKVVESVYLFTNIRTPTVNTSTSSFTVDFDTWIHVTVMWKKSTRQLSIYRNGVLFSIVTLNDFSDIVNKSIYFNYNGIFGGNGPGTSIPFFANDVRIYDNALSVKEIKEISKGLVCHYTLSDPYSTRNLIRNGFGEGGNENWSGVNVATDDLPTADTNIKAKFSVTGTGENVTYVPINTNHSYTISMYIKKASTSGATYPGFSPYDFDKKFIASYNCTEGFNSTYKTTLAQPLKKGDTIIYVTNLSAWTTGSNYYYHVAVFGYKNSDGYTYPDMIYTADSPAFGTRTDKSNIDKTNNTVTLLAPFEGEDRPVGTTICQATEGATYYYPFSVIYTDDVVDWTYKTYTFTPSKSNRLKACKYLRFRLGTRGYQAGIKLVDNTNNAVVYDSSGYNNHGEIYAYNAKGDIVISSDTPRNSISTFINSDDNTTHTASGTVFIYGNCKLETPRQLTIAFWCKPIAGYLGVTGNGQFCTTAYDKGMSAGRDYNATAMHHRDGTVDVTNVDGTDKRLSIVFTANEWHHYAFVYDGRYCRSYRDGVEQSSIDMGTEISLKSFNAIVIGYSNAGGVYRSNKSYYSDFRVYTTALSVDDILELYHTPISIAKTGETFTQGEYIET